MSAAPKHLMIGLKGSGKTTFLAALWHLLESDESATLLRARHLIDDREYLNRIRDSWLSLRDVGRTSMRAEQELTLPLQDSRNNATFDVTLPDLSGESYRVQWSERHTSDKFAALARHCSGLLIFVHPDSVNRPKRIPHHGSGDTSALDNEKRPAVKTDWSPEHAPTQVQLVELVQFVEYLRELDTPLRIALVISAWDTVKDFRPAAWFARRLPLLSQFLSSRNADFPHRIFGISAQGGDLNMDRARLLKLNEPSKRIRVVEAESEHSDLTAPVRFTLTGEAPAETSDE